MAGHRGAGSRSGVEGGAQGGGHVGEPRPGADGREREQAARKRGGRGARLQCNLDAVAVTLPIVAVVWRHRGHPGALQQTAMPW